MSGRSVRVTRWLVPVSLLTSTLGGCYVADRLLGNYTGPMPERIDLVQEAVVVRDLSRDRTGPRADQVTSAFLDRVRYLTAGDLKNVNRVILGQTWDVAARIDSLGIAVGDTVLVTTRYANVHRGGTARGVIPEWPGTDRSDYPVGWHEVQEIRRKSD